MLLDDSHGAFGGPGEIPSILTNFSQEKARSYKENRAVDHPFMDNRWLGKRFQPVKA